MPISDDSVNAFMSLDEGQQRSALSSMSPESKSALLEAINSRPARPATPTGLTATVSKPETKYFWEIPGLEKISPAISETLSPAGLRRAGERIKQNIYAVPNALDALKNEALGKPLTPDQQAVKDSTTAQFGGENAPGIVKAAHAAAILPQTIYDMGKSWVQDPSNAVGDIVSGIVMHHATASPVDEAVPEKMSSTRPNLTKDQQAAYTKSLDKANQSHAEALAEYAEKEADARAKWVQRAFKAKQSAVDNVKAVNKKAVLDRGAQEYTRIAQENIQKTHNAVRAQLDGRWNSLRDAMTDATVPAEDLFNAVQDAKAKFLRGSPASTAQFNNLVKEIGIENFVEDEHGNMTAAPGNQPVPWDTARVHSSAIGRVLSSGNLPGNVYQALNAVRTAIEDQLGKAAETQGRGPEYQAVRKDWSNYMTDWQDTSGVAKGGSPLAHAMQSPDVPTVQKIVSGPAGDRMIGTLAKYKKFGGRPDLLASARSTAAAADEIKVPRTTPTPPPYETDVPPELKQVPPPEAIPKKLGPLAKGVTHLAGGTAGASLMSPTGHTFVGYMAGSKALTAAAEHFMEGENPAVPPKFRIPAGVSRATRRATGAPAAAGVIGSRLLRGDDPDSKAINDVHEDIQKFIDSLPK